MEGREMNVNRVYGKCVVLVNNNENKNIEKLFLALHSIKKLNFTNKFVSLGLIAIVPSKLLYYR